MAKTKYGKGKKVAQMEVAWCADAHKALEDVSPMQALLEEIQQKLTSLPNDAMILLMRLTVRKRMPIVADLVGDSNQPHDPRYCGIYKETGKMCKRCKLWSDEILPDGVK
jgi:hypothetical protein